MTIVIVGAGVIGSTYGDRLARSGQDVTLLARGRRLADLRAHGLVVEDASSGQRTQISLPVLDQLSEGDRYDLALVPVRAEQLASTLPVLLEMDDRTNVLFFGNTTGRQTELAAALGERALFGFPAAGGVRDGVLIRYVIIKKQKTMLGEWGGTSTPRIARLQTMFADAGFPTNISTDIGGWMLGHSAFVVPIGFALYRCGSDPTALAADTSTLRLMVRATREAFEALDEVEIPANLRWLYLRMPMAFAVRYWRRVFSSPRGDEMHALAHELGAAVLRAGRKTPNLDALVGTR
jgi:2-dehydropantoate 2-reductase